MDDCGDADDKGVALVRDIMYESLTLLIMITPLALLHSIVRVPKLYAMFLEAMKNSDDLHFWDFALPLLPVALIGIVSSVEQSTDPLPNITLSVLNAIGNVTGNYTTAVGIVVISLLTRKFARDFDELNFENVNEPLQNVVQSYNSETRDWTNLLNTIFLVPMFFLWLLYLMIQLFFFIDDVTNASILEVLVDVIWTSGASIMLCTLLVPAAEFTSRNNRRTYDKITELSKNHTNLASIVWLNMTSFGWRILSIEISNTILLGIIYFLVSGILLIMSRFITISR